MPKIGLFTDAHFSSASSILNSRSGYEYSARLDYLMKSFEWLYNQFAEKGVDLIINGWRLG